MDWLHTLLFGTGIAHSILVLTLAICVGIFLGEKLKFKGITLGVTWILFCGILFAHCGMTLDPQVESFAKDFGLILFVYSIGLQVGPSFFSSFGKGSLSLNMLAMGIVLTSCVVALGLHFLTGVDIATMTGILFGAVTNTPGLGAAQQAYTDSTGVLNPNIANGYAMAYPLGVIGILVSMMLLKLLFRISLPKEEERVESEKKHQDKLKKLDIRLTNPQVDGVRIADLQALCRVNFVVSRLVHPNGTDMVADAQSVLHAGDIVRVVVDERWQKSMLLLGEKTQLEDETANQPAHLISRHIVVTKTNLNGKRIGDLHIREMYHISITRIRRAGVELLATHDLILQLGDRITVVGEEQEVEKVAEVFGNSAKRLDVPNLAGIFFGIVMGVILGMLPISLPGLAMPFKLGLAGGTLIVAILISCFGPKYRVITYTTSSANLMIREIGIALFLAAVGFGAGKSFFDTLMAGGYVWIGYGVIITMLPLLLMGFVGRACMHLDYFTLMGLIAGSTTDPPALAYATSQSSLNDRAAVAYSTVYPLTMFLRVLTGQLLILVFL